TVIRTVGDDPEVGAFATYAAVAIALIGTLPDTLHDRSVVIELKRRLAKEKIKPFRFDRADHLDVLARKAARWAADNAEAVGRVDPGWPPGVTTGEADNWVPLWMTAKVVGGGGPARVRRAATIAHGAAAMGDAGSRLELLLGDIRDIFGEQEEMSSADIVQALIKIEGRPWAEMGKARKPMTQNMLARMLKLLKPLKMAGACEKCWECWAQRMVTTPIELSH